MVFKSNDFSQQWKDKWTEFDFAWLAGIIEGDGYIFYLKKGKHSKKNYPIIGFNNTDTILMDKVAKIFEKKPLMQQQNGFASKTNKILLKINVVGKRAERLYEKIKPYLVSKKLKN